MDIIFNLMLFIHVESLNRGGDTILNFRLIHCLVFIWQPIASRLFYEQNQLLIRFLFWIGKQKSKFKRS